MGERGFQPSGMLRSNTMANIMHTLAPHGTDMDDLIFDWSSLPQDVSGTRGIIWLLAERGVGDTQTETEICIQYDTARGAGKADMAKQIGCETPCALLDRGVHTIPTKAGLRFQCQDKASISIVGETDQKLVLPKDPAAGLIDSSRSYTQGDLL